MILIFTRCQAESGSLQLIKTRLHRANYLALYKRWQTCCRNVKSSESAHRASPSNRKLNVCSKHATCFAHGRHVEVCTLHTMLYSAARHRCSVLFQCFCFMNLYELIPKVEVVVSIMHTQNVRCKSQGSATKDGFEESIKNHILSSETHTREDR